jgi:GT2 family glycosyltransferase
MDAFWWVILLISIAALAWVYAIYPAIMWLVAPRQGEPVPEMSVLPGVSVILSLHNEESVLPKKLENCRAFDYPADKLEIIAVSDGSTDGTDRFLRACEKEGVRVLIPGVRIGKTEAQNRAVALARHEILFFTDATTTHPPDVLRNIVQRFGDPTVGCVSGQAVFRDDGSLTSTGLRMKQRHDQLVRDLQGKVRTLFGATGCVYAVRRKLYIPLRPDLVSDLFEPLKLLAAGYRTVYEDRAIGLVDRRPPDPRLEFARRSRIVLQGFRGLVHVRELLDPRRGLLQAISLATRRPLKWLTPLYALGTLASSIALAHIPVVRSLLVFQVVFYGTALVTWLLERRGVHVPRVLALPFYFTVICLAALAGMVRLLRGETGQTWEPVAR